MKNKTYWLEWIGFILIVILLFGMLIAGCTDDTGPEQSRMPAIDCKDHPGGIEGIFEEVAPRGNLCKYRYTTSTCTMKFLFDCDSLTSSDVLHFTDDRSQRIGEVHYLLFHIDSSAVDSFRYCYSQINETYKGRKNNDGVCDFEPSCLDTTSTHAFMMTFFDCPEFNADTLYLTL